MTDVLTPSRETRLHALNELVLARTAIRRLDKRQRCVSVCKPGAYATEWKTDSVSTLHYVLCHLLANGYEVMTLIPYAVWSARLNPCTLVPQLDPIGARFTVVKMVDGIIPVTITMAYEVEVS